MNDMYAFFAMMTDINDLTNNKTNQSQRNDGTIRYL